MPPVNLCRTCTAENCNTNFYLLSTQSEEFGKSVNDILQELINPSVENAESDEMPQSICSDCLDRLKNAYAFVLQAQQAHETLRKMRASALSQCLMEIPTDIPMLMDIKTEVEVDEVDLEPDCLISNSSECYQMEAASGTEEEDDDDEKPLNLRLTAKRLSKKKIKTERVIETNSQGRFECEVCGKSFSWHRDMLRHARVHFESASFVCGICNKAFLRKDKYQYHLRSHEKRQAKVRALQLKAEWRFAQRLYCGGRPKRLECKLCGQRCQRIQDLRKHLASHTSVESLAKLSSSSAVVTVHFDSASQLSLAEIKQQICADIAAHNLDKYGAFVNAYGYELALSDSDEEEPHSERYSCGPCNLPHSRKHRLIRHTLEVHTETKNAPVATCLECKIGFVDDDLFKQHQRSQCHNEMRRFRCPQCPGRFMWPENVEKHACSHRRPPVQAAIKQKKTLGHFQCCLCHQELSSLKELRTHLPQHSDGSFGIDPDHQAAFFKAFGGKSTQEELSARIAADFVAEDFNRFYNACDEWGQELDLNDSEDSDGGGGGEHSCDICGQTAQRLRGLLLHQAEAHLQEQEEGILPYPCNDCGLGYVCEALLSQHRRKVCDKKHAEYECPNCQLRFVWESNYLRHLKAVHGGSGEKAVIGRGKYKKRQDKTENLQCDQCSKVFNWSKDLTRHMRMHSAKTQYECTQCDRKFHRKDNLKSHMVRKHGESETSLLPKLEVEDEKSRSISPMEAEATEATDQEAADASFQCTICLRRYNRKDRLTAHVKKCHSSASTTSLVFQCATCPKKYNRKDRLTAHTKSCHTGAATGVKRKLSAPSAKANDSLQGKSFLCAFCGKTMCSSSNLIVHMRRHTGEKPFKCDYCDMAFPRTSDLQCHRRTHTGERPYICTVCQKGFTRSYKMHQHMRIHSGEKPYKCTYCEKSFAQSNDLTLHIRRHTGERPYQCEICGERFIQGTALKYHRQQHGHHVSKSVKEEEAGETPIQNENQMDFAVE